MAQMGKMIILMGLVLIVIGLLVWGLERTGFRGLPGDIRYASDRGSFYFPIVTCLVISAFLTLGVWLWRWFGRS